MYEATYSRRGEPRHAFFTQSERLKFAEESIAALQKKCPESLVNGLVRVDIMQNDSGEMIVNEFESLEADHAHSDKTIKVYYDFSNQMKMYYVNILCSCTNEIIKERKLN